MRDLIDFTIQCMNELDRIGIPYGNVIDVTINTRAKKRWGQCRKVPGGFTININVVLLDEKNDVDGLRNTIFHELLHTCPDCWNHGTQWKAYAAMIRRELGYNIQRTSSAEEKGVITEPETRLSVIVAGISGKDTRCARLSRESKISDVDIATVGYPRSVMDSKSRAKR